jgi:hypothetical protein
METGMNEDIARFDEEGYVVVRNVLTPEMIERLRKKVPEHFQSKGVIYRYGETQPNAAADVEGLDWLIAHPEIIALYRQILGTDDVSFTAHCDMHNQMAFGWHKDDGQGRYMMGDYFNEPRKVVKVGVYLDDARDGSGMTLKPGSHRAASLDWGKELTVLSQPGDLLFFDVRISHRGKEYDVVEKTILKLGRWAGDTNGRSKLGLKARYFYRWLRKSKNKRSVFFTYGANDEHTEYFAQANMTRQVEQNSGSAGTLSAELRDSLARQNIRICEAAA